jgi:lysophospholipase L1-like esterase
MNFKDRKNFFIGFMTIALGGLLFYFLKPYVPQRLFTENTRSTSIVVDSLMLKAMDAPVNDQPVTQDSLDQTPKLQKTQPLNQKTQKPITYTPERLIEISDFNFKLVQKIDSAGIIALPQSLELPGYNGMKQLSGFYKKLMAVEQDSSKSVRIAYYGDSMIDGDLIVQDLRSALQSRFGGRGVGFVSATSESERSRYSIKHKSSGNWKRINYMKTVSDSLNYGVNGAVFYTIDSTAQIDFTASGIKNSYRLNSPRLFYGKGNETATIHSFTDRDTLTSTHKLNGTKNLNTLVLSANDLKSLKVNFSQVEKIPIYGIDFFNDEGITVDGFSNRGNSGLPLSLLKPNFISEFNKELDYDLVMLQFGANVLSTQKSTFGWYSSRMTRVVAHIRQLYPTADILIIGTADRGTKTENLVQTDTAVVRLLRSQQEYAAATDSGFISLFHLMGGINSMISWEQHKLANSDFTHFSPKGSRVIGKLIYDELMVGYDAAVLAERSRSAKAELLKKSSQEKKILKKDSVKNDTISIKIDFLKGNKK